MMRKKDLTMAWLLTSLMGFAGMDGLARSMLAPRTGGSRKLGSCSRCCSRSGEVRISVQEVFHPG